MNNVVSATLREVNAIDRTASDKQTSRTLKGFFKDKLLFKD